MELSSAELDRYARHLTVPGIGLEGQSRLKESSVLLVGTGGLGSPAALYLAAAGVGRMGLVDDDVVSRSNLQRQILHGESWVGKPKLESAVQRLAEVNPHVQVEPHACRLTPDNAADLVSQYDLVLDGSDNFPTRFLTNDVCFQQKKPCVYGSIFRFEGQVTVFAPHLGGPCYRCMLPSVPPSGAAPSCEEAGVLGVLPGIVGSLQAMEAIKFLLGVGQLPLGKLICYDALRTSFRTLRLAADPQCALCGTTPTVTSLHNPETLASAHCAVEDPSLPSLSVENLANLLAGGPVALLDVRRPEEFAVASIPGSVLIPLHELEHRLDEVPHGSPLYVHCKSGMRSAKAVAMLRTTGRNAINIEGGIDAWLNRQKSSSNV
ncbi:adenylyltransferase/sulfurtransferase [Haloferula luteola]|uniref:Molybdopterin-synthase adenylyltransferase n=1 Tax=Haloferula luteola TaxID=595692 RepID=A0A840V7A7_9BACT|nr:molybdopterin-synthase adenylyltransferase MoeB [Haloferula luteola]MBB5349840.1 adenylyltransferase/sulfurtransferase [Haloferula luteola]